MRRCSHDAGLPAFSPIRTWPWWPGWLRGTHCSRPTGPKRGLWGIPFVSRTQISLLCLAPAANMHISLVEWKHAPGQADKLHTQVSASVCTWANFSFEHKVLFEHFTVGLMGAYHWELFVSTECHLSMLPVGSEGYLLLMIVSEHKELSSVTLASWCWCVSDVEGHFCGGGVYLGLNIVYSLGRFVMVLSSGVWTCIPFVWSVSLLSFVKWQVQVQFIRKALAMKLQLKK